jgi:hypothetical protein
MHAIPLMAGARHRSRSSARPPKAVTGEELARELADIDRTSWGKRRAKWEVVLENAEADVLWASQSLRYLKPWGAHRHRGSTAPVRAWRSIDVQQSRHPQSDCGIMEDPGNRRSLRAQARMGRPGGC